MSTPCQELLDASGKREEEAKRTSATGNLLTDQDVYYPGQAHLTIVGTIR